MRALFLRRRGQKPVQQRRTRTRQPADLGGDGDFLVEDLGLGGLQLPQPQPVGEQRGEPPFGQCQTQLGQPGLGDERAHEHPQRLHEPLVAEGC